MQYKMIHQQIFFLYHIQITKSNMWHTINVYTLKYANKTTHINSIHCDKFNPIKELYCFICKYLQYIKRIVRRECRYSTMYFIL